MMKEDLSHRVWLLHFAKIELSSKPGELTKAQKGKRTGWWLKQEYLVHGTKDWKISYEAKRSSSSAPPHISTQSLGRTCSLLTVPLIHHWHSLLIKVQLRLCSSGTEGLNWTELNWIFSRVVSIIWFSLLLYQSISALPTFIPLSYVELKMPCPWQ